MNGPQKNESITVFCPRSGHKLSGKLGADGVFRKTCTCGYLIESVRLSENKCHIIAKPPDGRGKPKMLFIENDEFSEKPLSTGYN